MNNRIAESTNNDLLDETPVSFATDIAPLFTTKDVNCMKIRQNDRGQNIVLSDYAYMGDPLGDVSYDDYANARHVYARLTGDEKPQMPMGAEKKWNAPDNPAGQTNLATYERWMSQGFRP